MPAQPNGLTPKDEKTLRGILAKAAALKPCIAYMGGAERRDLDRLIADTTLRLEPTSVETLADRAEKYFAPVARMEWGAKALQGVE